MKILHIMTYYHENMGYQDNWLPYFQKELGHEIKILAADRYFLFPDYDISMKPILGDRIVGEGVYYDKGIEIIRKKPIFEYAKKNIVLFDLNPTLNEFQPDVIHLHGIVNLNIFQLLYHKKRNNVKLFIDSHTDYQVVNFKSLFNKLYYKLWTFIYRKFDNSIEHFLPITEEAQLFLENEFKIDFNRTTINHLGVNIDKFYYEKKLKAVLQEKLDCKNDLILINAGKQYDGKKILFIIDILISLIDDFKLKNIKLILIGNANDEYNNKIIKKIEGYEKYIIRRNFMKNDELNAYYCLADMGIWPGVPSNTIQEAMACNTAMVLANNKTVSHLVDGNGFLIIEESAYKVATEIVHILQKEQLEMMKSKSRELACEYSWKRIAEKCLEIYENK